MVNDMVEQFNAASAGGLAQRMGIVITAAEQGRVEATMPVDGNTQPYGLLHGGASAALAETIGSIAGAIHAGPSRMIVGVDLSCTHHRAVRSGTVTGIATRPSGQKNWPVTSLPHLRRRFWLCCRNLRMNAR